MSDVDTQDHVGSTNKEVNLTSLTTSLHHHINSIQNDAPCERPLLVEHFGQVSCQYFLRRWVETLHVPLHGAGDHSGSALGSATKQILQVGNDGTQGRIGFLINVKQLAKYTIVHDPSRHELLYMRSIATSHNDQIPLLCNAKVHQCQGHNALE